MSLTLSPTDSPTDLVPFAGHLAGLLSLLAIAQGARWLVTWRYGR